MRTINLHRFNIVHGILGSNRSPIISLYFYADNVVMASYSLVKFGQGFVKRRTAVVEYGIVSFRLGSVSCSLV